ncbi:MAG TPA: hypothetical protein VKB23_10960 [Solirubrobacterales bacterium]|nr:hypothetical protein [Solirubrobacterales bacterium]
MPFLIFAAIALIGAAVHIVLWADFIAPLVAIGLYVASRAGRARPAA